MQLRRDIARWPQSLRGGIIAIGNFDGLHKGHQSILDYVSSEAKRLSIPAIMLTFEPHPRHYFQPSSPVLRLQRFADKARMVQSSGFNAILAQSFNTAFAELSAESFVQSILIDALGAHTIVTGDEFVFGHQRGGNTALLRQFAEQGHFTYKALAPLGNAGEGKYSSSKVREHLRQGEMPLAASLLGRPYSWTRPVVHGAKRGRQIGFPTANLIPPPVMLPRFGVYVVQCQWQGGESYGIANLGIRPTFGAAAPLLEVHLFQETVPSLYGLALEVNFLSYIRGEQQFASLDALKAQIAIDVTQAKALCSAL